MSSPSSGSKDKSSKKPACTRQNAKRASCFLLASRPFFDPEDGSGVSFRNVDDKQSKQTVSYLLEGISAELRRAPFYEIWKPLFCQIAQGFLILNLLSAQRSL
jgi:hypothetical protein